MTSNVRRSLRRIVDALQLGLFDAPAPLPSAVPGPAAPTVEPPGPPSPDCQPAAAPALLAEPLRHPEATREALLDGRVVAFRLVRVRRRSIGFVVDVKGLTVRAAERVPLREIDVALHEKRSWILARLAEQRERSARAASVRVVWRDGVAIDYLGEKLTVVLDPSRAGASVDAVVVGAQQAPHTLRRLLVGLPRDASAERIQDAVQGWLQRQARRVFAERAAHFSTQLGVRVRRLSLSSAATRWGSANANGSVRLHWRLIEHPLATIDYVVAHELAHLKEMNHSPRFWRIVESVVPDYREVRRGLRVAEHR